MRTNVFVKKYNFDVMNIDELRILCLGMPYVTEDVKWGDNLVFSVGTKMFCITSLNNVPLSASFKAAEQDFEALIMREGFKAAPYLARYKWVWLRDLNLLSRKEWELLLQVAYDEVKKKLPKRVLNEMK